jgi:hypothetical protein
MNKDAKRCPLNRFKECIQERCAFSTMNEGKVTCAIPFIGHELFYIADVVMTGGVPLVDKHVDAGGSVGIPAKP